MLWSFLSSCDEDLRGTVSRHSVLASILVFCVCSNGELGEEVVAEPEAAVSYWATESACCDKSIIDSRLTSCQRYKVE